MRFFVYVFVRAYHGEFLYQAYQGGYGAKTLGFAGLLPIISVIIAFVLISFDMTDREIGSIVSAGLISLNLIVFLYL